MLSEVQKKRFNGLFDQMDASGNGILEFTDFSAHVRHIQKAKGWKDDHKAVKKLLEAKRNFWTELQKRSKSKNPEAITRDEWMTFLTNVVGEVKKTGKVPEWVSRIHYVLLQSLDVDGDGKISLDEYRLYLESIKSDADPKDAFKRVDADGNGYLSLDELEDIFSQWILSNDANDPGTYFMTGKRAA